MLKNGVNYFTEELYLTIPDQEAFDERTETFFTIKGQTIRLKHSLVSISKWEAKYKTPFLDKTKPKTFEQNLDYMRFMTITQNVDPMFYRCLNNDQIKLVNSYISEQMTGTKIREQEGKRGNSLKPISAEEIYYWMTEYNIPPEYSKWHLSRLLMLIRVCGIRSAPRKGGKKDKGQVPNYRALNNARRKKHHTRG